MKRVGLLIPALLCQLALPNSANAQAQVDARGSLGVGGSSDANASATSSAPSTAAAGSGTTTATAAGAAGAEAAPADEITKEWAERDRKLDESATLTGGIGLLHTQHAQGGAVGQFRVAFTTEYMSAGFLCSSEFPCPNPRAAGTSLTSDNNDHIGGHLTLSMQVLKWLEPYLSTSAYANSNSANRPTLLQVLGDSTLGAKVHAPLNKVFYVGGAAELWLVNGTGSVGLDGGGTSAKFRALGTADLRGMQKRIPLRFSLNTTYVLDNTGEVVKDTETARGTPITRIERYGLNINRVDHFDINIGAEVFAVQDRIRPFVEYGIAIPINRQDYRCRPNNPSNDKCLANNAVAPSSLTVGSRFFPWKGGFNVTAALDIGITGVGNFIEEVRPTPPWMLYLGAGWAFDTKDRPTTIVQREIVQGPPTKSGRKIHGFVHEEGKSEGVANAIVSWDNHPELTSLATGADGHFLTQELEEGPYAFGIRAEGFKPGQCTATVVREGSGPAAPPPPAPTGHGGSAASQSVSAPTGPQLHGDIQIDCALQALPRAGTIVGHVKDADTQAVVPNATVKVIDVAKKELSGAVDGSGNVRFDQVAPGAAQITVDAEGYLALTEQTDVKPRQDNNVDLLMKKRPKTSNVSVTKGEIIIKQQIQFALDSATILPESNGLLSEIADVLIKNPRIHKIEVQGHTDNTGTPEHNKALSEDRANAVVTWLGTHGVASDRLVAHGYGQTKPLVPNVTAGNRAKNRRVQFIITDQDAAPAGAAKPKLP
ncbi:OmpA family protein [Labilithrix luteola]|uniref:OmpA family protein n=1 Tax=Labilithrix luteola TaxID=1391654 RepID=UPI00196A0422|nr:OmpA family protein [Labilithrix luteola]